MRCVWADRLSGDGLRRVTKNDNRLRRNLPKSALLTSLDLYWKILRSLWALVQQNAPFFSNSLSLSCFVTCRLVHRFFSFLFVACMKQFKFNSWKWWSTSCAQNMLRAEPGMFLAANKPPARTSSTGGNRQFWSNRATTMLKSTRTLLQGFLHVLSYPQRRNRRLANKPAL